MNAMTEEEKLGISRFISSCNEMINGKFILADNKIISILKEIAACKPLYDLLESCMVSFNFNRVFAIAKVKAPTRPGYLVMPEDTKSLLPLVFCLLIDIQNRTLILSDFLKDYFSVPDDEGVVGYQKFGKQVIEPFKNTVAKYFGIPTDMNSERTKIKEGELKMENEQKIDVYAKDISKIVTEMTNELESDKKAKQELKNDALYLLSALNFACENKEIKYINSLIIAFGYMQHNFKSLGFLYKEMKQRLVDYYS